MESHAHTFTTMRNMLGDQGAQDAITTMWGRSLRGHHGKANEATAVSVQVHATVTKEAFLPLLSKSGFCKIYANPKNTAGKLDTTFRVLWIPGELAQVTTAAATTQQCCGLVKGKNSYMDFDSPVTRSQPHGRRSIPTHPCHNMQVERIPTK